MSNCFPEVLQMILDSRTLMYTYSLQQNENIRIYFNRQVMVEKNEVAI